MCHLFLFKLICPALSIQECVFYIVAAVYQGQYELTYHTYIYHFRLTINTFQSSFVQDLCGLCGYFNDHPVLEIISYTVIVFFIFSVYCFCSISYLLPNNYAFPLRDLRIHHLSLWSPWWQYVQVRYAHHANLYNVFLWLARARDTLAKC